MFCIDDYVGIAIAGLTLDARVLRSVNPYFFPLRTLLNPFLFVCIRMCSNFMRQQAMASKMVFNWPVPVNRLVSTIADSASFPSLYLYVLPSGGGRALYLSYG